MRFFFYFFFIKIREKKAILDGSFNPIHPAEYGLELEANLCI